MVNKSHTKLFIALNLLMLPLMFCVSIKASSADEHAQRELKYFKDLPSASELADHLFPLRARGLAVAETQKPIEKSIGLPVLFNFGKATLVDSSKPFLDQLGELLQQTDYANEILIIEGHTDIVGSSERNDKLSELRALSVKDYLVKRHKIDPLRLITEGKGESRLYDAENPLAAVNRRVEFIRFTP